MSDRDQEIIGNLRRAYEAFNRADFDTAMKVAHAEIEFVPPGGQSPLRGAQSFLPHEEIEALEAAGLSE